MIKVVGCDFTEKELTQHKHDSLTSLNSIQDGTFRGCSRMVGGGGGRVQKGRALKTVTHILQWWNSAQLYLRQRRSKKYVNHVTHPLSYADISHQDVFTRNQEIDLQIPFWYIISDSFKVFWVFKDWFRKHGYNLDDVSKIVTLGLLEIKVL